MVSIALCHHRLQNVPHIVNDINTGKVRPDKIHFFISKEPYLLDKGIQPNEIPKLKNQKNVSFHYVENIGLLRKFIPVIRMYWNQPDTRIIIFDDDRKPQKDTISTLAWWSMRHPDAAFTLGGYTMSPYRPVVSWLIPRNKLVHVSATGIGLVVRPKFFKREDIINWKQYNDDKVDVTISSEVFNTFLFKKNNVPLYCVKASCPTQYPEGGTKVTGGPIYKTIKASKCAQYDKWREVLMK